MANVDAAFGFKPVRYRSGAPYNGAATRYYIASGETNNIFIGDPVALSGTGGEIGDRGLRPGVARAAASSDVVGVVVGFENLTSDNLSRTYRPASTEGYLLVADDPDLIFEVQEDSDTSTLAATNIGQNIDHIIGTGSTTTGVSAVELDSSTAANTATLSWRLVGISSRVGNAIGANASWLVVNNSHPYTNTTGA